MDTVGVLAGGGLHFRGFGNWGTEGLGAPTESLAVMSLFQATEWGKAYDEIGPPASFAEVSFPFDSG